MTLEQLIAEGRALQRECVFLQREGSGQIAAVWHEFDDHENDRTGFRRWITVDTVHIPAMQGLTQRYLSVLTDANSSALGHVELLPQWPARGGIPLYARSVGVLPPVDAVFAKGSEAVARWLESHKWNRGERYHSGFGDWELADQYERVWMNEYPFYLREPPYAVLGGWHWPGPDDDWHALIDEQLLVLTVQDSEPWVETWRLANGEFKVIQRIT